MYKYQVIKVNTSPTQIGTLLDKHVPKVLYAHV